jgi:hypothetical protein
MKERDAAELSKLTKEAFDLADILNAAGEEVDQCG